MIEIDGSETPGAWGLTIRADNTTVRGIAINQFGTDIVLDDVTNNVIQGNFIGTDITGTSNPGAGGVLILGSSNNIIGGTADSTRNVIVGSVEIISAGATGNIIRGNYIGTDVTGTIALNMSSGVAIQDSAQNNTIVGNLISGNNGHGILMSGNEVRGNSILDNLIGTDLTGSNPLGNGLTGIAFLGGVQNNIIGAPGQGNIIADSGEEGIWFSGSGTTGNIFQSNYIGTDTTGTINLGNTYRGLYLMQETGDNKIGGIEDGEGNIIAFNGEIGIGLQSNVSTGNAILSNSIYSNGLQGIDLGLDGVSYNDDGDGDVGANNLQNYPELFAAADDTNIVQIAGTLNSSPNTSYRIEFFLNDECDPSGYGEGEEFIDFTSVATNSSGSASFYVTFTADVDLGEYITATATDPDGNSSEFSQCVEVTLPESQISVALDIFTYSLNVGQITTETLTISNMGSSVLEWSIDSDSNWINTDSDSGTVVPGNTDTVRVIIDATNLGEGYYLDTLLISSNDPNNPTIELPVDLFVTSYPEIVLEPDTFIVTLNEGIPGLDTLIIKNVGVATLNWTVGWTFYSHWLSAEPTSGATDPGDSSLVIVTINAIDSTFGTYEGVLIINSDDPDVPSIDVPVFLTIVFVGVPEINVSPDSISVSIYEGETFTETLIVENIGTSELEWIINWEEQWLNVNPDSGRTEAGNSDSLEVIIDGSELSVGLHTDTLTVSSNDVDNPTVDILVVIDVTALGTDEFSELPKQFELMQNYPNPFNPTTTFRYNLPKQADVQIVIYDLLGKKVITLVSETQEAGYKSITWDATNIQGQPVSAGVYFYQIQAGDFNQTRKMILLK